jgi:hypothetical protein
MGPVTELQSARAEALRDFVARIRSALGAHPREILEDPFLAGKSETDLPERRS